MRITTLQWAIGLYCAILGAMMLIVPHRFDTVTYAVLRPHLTWWGAGFLLAGISLLTAAEVPFKSLVVATHCVAGAVLLMLVHGFMLVDRSGTAANYAVLGLGTALAPALRQRAPEKPVGDSRDLLALLIGLGTALTGMSFVGNPVPGALFFALVRTTLDWYGLAFIVTGLSLAYAHFRLPPRPVLWALHAAAGAALLVFAARTAVPSGDWNGIAYYGGFGVLVAILPWLGPAIGRINPSSLRVRLALVLIGAVAAPLIIVATIVTDRAEQSASAQALGLQQTIAATLADDISRYLSFHQAAAAGVAEAINLVQMSPGHQETLLRSLGSEYPNVLSFATYDDQGRPIARGDSLPRRPIGASPVFEKSRRTDGPSQSYRFSFPAMGLVFEFGAPLRRPDGSWAGLLVVTAESVRVVTELQRVSLDAHGKAYLVDGDGRLVAHQNAQLTGSFKDISGSPPVAALLSQRHPDGVLRFSDASGEQLAGFARVAGTVLGVVVERPLDVALAGMHSAREIAFEFLLVLVGGAAVGGAFAAGVLARPLEALAHAARRVGETGDARALPDTTVAEVRDLSRTFGEMSARLAARTEERERAYEGLREREALIRSIMESTSDGFIFVAADGRIQSVNRRATALLPPGLAWTAGEELADAMAGVDAPPAQRAAVLAVLDALEAGRDPAGAGDLEVAAGSRVLHWDAQPASDESGRLVGLTFTLRDVTEERQVSRIKTDFVSFVTHQLRTPLSGIKWLLELAADTHDAGELRAYIKDAREANERLVGLVNDLLDISRLESGRLSVSLQELHLGMLTQSVLEELAPLIKEKGHRISLRVAEGLPPVVADPQLLREVIMNLISNAIKYTPQPGAIDLQMRPQNGSVQWTVRDTGIGIPKDALPRLFEKFYRADNVHTVETEGTGLGLHLVRLIVERFGGRIWCESEEGRGATFRFTVPMSGGRET